MKTFQSKPLFISNGQGISLDTEADTSIDKTIETANINEGLKQYSSFKEE